MSLLFEVHQIKGSKITDVDEVGIDAGGICVSERGPRELPGVRGDLGMLKPGQASKEKNGQVMGAGLEDVHVLCCWLRALCSGSLYHGLIWRCFHGDPIAVLAPCSAQAVELPVHLQRGRVRCWGGVEGRGMGEVQRMAEQASHTPRAGLPCPRCCSAAVPCSTGLAAIPGSPRAPGPGNSVPRRPSPVSAGARGTFSSSSSSTLMNGCSTELWEHFPEA